MPMTLQALDDWLHSYGLAWESRNPQAAADLYAEDATYQVTPFLEPLRGKPAILDYWTHVAKTQQNIEFGYEILAITPEHGIAHWWLPLSLFPPASQPNSTESSSSPSTKMAAAVPSASGGTSSKIDRYASRGTSMSCLT